MDWWSAIKVCNKVCSRREKIKQLKGKQKKYDDGTHYKLVH